MTQTNTTRLLKLLTAVYDHLTLIGVIGVTSHLFWRELRRIRLERMFYCLMISVSITELILIILWGITV